MSVTIALVGDENPSYPTHREVNAVRGLLGPDVLTRWLPTNSSRPSHLEDSDGIWLTPGSPYASDKFAYEAITFARRRDVPFLGTCGGFQYAIVEFFRNVLGKTRASHAESEGISDDNVVALLGCSLQGEQRLVQPIPGTRFARLVDDEARTGMHYCSYGPGPGVVDELVSAGLNVEAVAGELVEVLALPTNRFYFLTLFQPQIGALAGDPLHPLLAEFVRCVREHAT